MRPLRCASGDGELALAGSGGPVVPGPAVAHVPATGAADQLVAARASAQAVGAVGALEDVLAAQSQGTVGPRAADELVLLRIADDVDEHAPALGVLVGTGVAALLVRARHTALVGGEGVALEVVAVAGGHEVASGAGPVERDRVGGPAVRRRAGGDAEVRRIEVVRALVARGVGHDVERAGAAHGAAGGPGHAVPVHEGSVELDAAVVLGEDGGPASRDRMRPDGGVDQPCGAVAGDSDRASGGVLGAGEYVVALEGAVLDLDRACEGADRAADDSPAAGDDVVVMEQRPLDRQLALGGADRGTADPGPRVGASDVVVDQGAVGDDDLVGGVVLGGIYGAAPRADARLVVVLERGAVHEQRVPPEQHDSAACVGTGVSRDHGVRDLIALALEPLPQEDAAAAGDGRGVALDPRAGDCDHRALVGMAGGRDAAAVGEEVVAGRLIRIDVRVDDLEQAVAVDAPSGGTGVGGLGGVALDRAVVDEEVAVGGAADRASSASASRGDVAGERRPGQVERRASRDPDEPARAGGIAAVAKDPRDRGRPREQVEGPVAGGGLHLGLPGVHAGDLQRAAAGDVQVAAGVVVATGSAGELDRAGGDVDPVDAAGLAGSAVVYARVEACGVHRLAQRAVAVADGRSLVAARAHHVDVDHGAVRRGGREHDGEDGPRDHQASLPHSRPPREL